MLGDWTVNIDVNGMPEKVATAVAKLSEQLVGAEYTPIAYLGSQLVNGINHAVLAEQLLITGKDTKNIVVLIFNEKGMDCSLVNIERVLTGGEGMGATTIDVKTDIPQEAKEAYDNTMLGYVGFSIKLFALLATQITHGTEYYFAASVEPMTLEGKPTVAIVKINDMLKSVEFIDILNKTL